MVAPNSSSSVSARKRAANRRNAQHSTGPRTVEGKARSRLNATTHGLFSSQVVLPDEDSEAFVEMKHGILRRLNPRDVLELQLANQVVMISWRLDRLRTVERRAYQVVMEDRARAGDSWLEMFQVMVKDHEHGVPPEYARGRKLSPKELDGFDRMIGKVRQFTETMEPAQPMPSTAVSTRRLIDSGELDRLWRYETRLQGNLHRALGELRQLRKDRREGILDDFTAELLAENEPTDEAEECKSNSEEELAGGEEEPGIEPQDEPEMKMSDEVINSSAEPSESSPRAMADDPGGGRAADLA